MNQITLKLFLINVPVYVYKLWLLISSDPDNLKRITHFRYSHVTGSHIINRVLSPLIPLHMFKSRVQLAAHKPRIVLKLFFPECLTMTPPMVGLGRTMARRHQSIMELVKFLGFPCTTVVRPHGSPASCSKLCGQCQCRYLSCR